MLAPSQHHQTLLLTWGRLDTVRLPEDRQRFTGRLCCPCLLVTASSPKFSQVRQGGSRGVSHLPLPWCTVCRVGTVGLGLSLD